ncbi:nicotinate phosphoribosyltransferase [Clavulina sp. PMI_390]|nr:nicotinate phosphoribosyltransferase [Clavulina sp. PMI_390]
MGSFLSLIWSWYPMAGTSPSHGSILDTDLYKLTMQQAVLEHFPNAVVRYKFNNRSKQTEFSRSCLAVFQQKVTDFANRQLQDDEVAWLKRRCSWFKDSYLDYLKAFRFHPDDQVSITFEPSTANPDRGQIQIEVHGLWAETILYEVPLMAALSEAYFTTDDTDWSLQGQEENAYQKGLQLLKHGVQLSEFGTRRRRSFETHQLVMQGLMRAHKEISADPQYKGQLRGTSNVHFAHQFDVLPIGTIAHEWTMGARKIRSLFNAITMLTTAALLGYTTPNTTALKLWEATYPTENPANTGLHIALTDTFRSSVFFREIRASPDIARRWKGMRQDSGVPLEFAREAKKLYEELEIDVSTKILVFSDGLDVPRTLNIQDVNSKEIGFQASFGVGTSLTNDFKTLSTGEKSKALNIVIKLSEIDGKQCVKLSDDLGKNTGDQAAVAQLKRELGVE